MSAGANYQPGDWINFRSPTRSGCKTALRKVIAVCETSGRPMVRYHGWSHFVVELHEVIGHSPGGCSCMEVHGEDPQCIVHGVDTPWGRANAEQVAE
ncbi:hypothetical protein [Novosphingobium sp. FSW06-99]|uniref:hypothetical protein n=1 Tax=Novosphingobium sp. FSW06-99 TaxID=1739113 RepID=UPI00076C963D|nr:hypothetical protein [Novosphingobium sp. FSW06-99]KUR80932.1 hypothetical protein AQZ49_02600 [Novosphingobium sp. FSW06-99]